MSSDDKAISMQRFTRFTWKLIWRDGCGLSVIASLVSKAEQDMCYLNVLLHEHITSYFLNENPEFACR